VLTLALGIGSVTVIYSVVHNVVVDPLPYRDAGRLVSVLVKDSQSPRVRGTFAVPELLDLRILRTPSRMSSARSANA
jgi:putative ABC transport system permease protein